MSLAALQNITSTTFQSTQFITGLRAYAALMVIMIHSGGAGLRSLGEVGNKAADLGATGVYIFFVISGFCISHSLRHKQSLKYFWWKRLWRIAPLYYAACFTALALLLISNIEISPWRSILGTQNIAYDAFMHFSFLSFADYRVTNSLIGTEWSIPIEMFWYIFMPFALPLTRKPSTAFILFSMTCAVFALKSVYGYFVPEEILGDVMKWSPLRYAPAFFLGMLSYTLRPWVLRVFPSKLLDLGLLALLACAFLELFIVQIGNEFLNILLLSAGIITIGGTGVISKLIFENKLAIYLGTISYSLYITHMFVIALLPQFFSHGSLLLKFIVITLFTVLISTLSYLFIEKKAMDYGQRLYAKRSLDS